MLATQKDRIVDDLNIFSELTLYFDKTEILQDVEARALRYASLNMLKEEEDEDDDVEARLLIQPFQVPVTLDLVLMTEYSGRFTDMMLQEPNLAEEFLRRYFHKCFIAMTEWRIDLNLVQVKIELSNLPVSKPFKQPYKFGVFNIRGVLVSKTTPMKFVESTVFACPAKMCSASKGERVSDLSVIPSCDLCGEQCREITKSRVSGERVYGVMVPDNYLDVTSSENSKIQGIVVEFPDTFHDRMVMGVGYNAMIKKDVKGSVCWGLIPMAFKIPRELNVSLLPNSVTLIFGEIRTRSSNSPWAMVNFLSTLVSPNLIPDMTSIHLKTGLLLSLASTAAKSPINILGLGNCSDIMFEATKLAQRALRPTLKLCTAPEGTLETNDGYNTYQTGPLLLASSGVLYLGNVPKIGSPLYEQIAKAVDSEKVILRAKASVPINPQSVSFPFRTAVWMHLFCNARSELETQRLKTAIHTFGMPFLSETESDIEANLERLLYEAQRKPTVTGRPVLSLSDFRQFVDIVSKQRLKIRTEASDIIRNYFVASRRDRPDCLPINAVKVLTELSECHARLSLKSTVEFEDAVAAIFLYEESASALFGHSLTSLRPKRVGTIYASPLDYVAEMDRKLEQFGRWVKDYVRRLISSESSVVFSDSE